MSSSSYSPDYYVCSETYGANEAIIRDREGYEHVLDQILISGIPAYYVAIKSDNGIDATVIRGKDIIAITRK
jgi:hypothetical protein